MSSVSIFKRWGLVVVFMLAIIVPFSYSNEGETGTLIFDVLEYESDVRIGKKIKKQLDHAGIRWGVEGDVILIPQVNERYVNSELPNFTRYGAMKELELRAGDYHITCIGYIHGSNSRDVDKVLSKSAFFNVSIMSFNILPGKTTKIVITPTYQKQTKHSLMVSTKMFMPDLMALIVEDGTEVTSKLINERLPSSIAWDDYSGPFKVD